MILLYLSQGDMDFEKEKVIEKLVHTVIGI